MIVFFYLLICCTYIFILTFKSKTYIIYTSSFYNIIMRCLRPALLIIYETLQYWWTSSWIKTSKLHSQIYIETYPIMYPERYITALFMATLLKTGLLSLKTSKLSEKTLASTHKRVMSQQYFNLWYSYYTLKHKKLQWSWLCGYEKIWQNNHKFSLFPSTNIIYTQQTILCYLRSSQILHKFWICLYHKWLSVYHKIDLKSLH